MTRNRWEHFEHGADIGVRGVGDTLEAAFEQAALALTAVVAELETVREAAGDAGRVDVECAAPDAALLLADWLNALIGEMSARGMLFRRYSVRIAGQTLRGQAWGEPVERAHHRPAVEVKAATYTELAVRREPDGQWVAQCVVDV